MKPYWRTALSYSVFQRDGSVPWVAEALGQVRRDGKPYPADPNWHDGPGNSGLPSTQEANGMKESYQKEEHCRD